MCKWFLALFLLKGILVLVVQAEDEPDLTYDDQVTSAATKLFCAYSQYYNFTPPQSLLTKAYKLCTHFMYFGATIDPTNGLLPQGTDPALLDVKIFDKNAKSILYIYGLPSALDARLILQESSEARRNLIKLIIKQLRELNYDGLCLNDQYATVSDDFVTVFRETIEEEVVHSGKTKLIFTMHIHLTDSVVNTKLNLTNLNENLDWIHLQVSAPYRPYEGHTSHGQPLYSFPEYSSTNSYGALDHAINFFTEQGIHPRDLVLFLPAGGYTFTLKDPAATYLGAPTTGPGSAKEFSHISGTASYCEICNKLRLEDGWTVVEVNKSAIGPYAYRRDQWVSFDDMDMIRKKTKYALRREIGGLLIFVNADDFLGKCFNRILPLTEAIKNTIFTYVLRKKRVKEVDEKNSHFDVCEKLEYANQKPQCLNGTKLMSCSKLSANNKTVSKCKTYSRHGFLSHYREIVCDEGKKKDRVFDKCVLVVDCGRTVTNLQPQIAGGVNEKVGRSPWHVAIYKKKTQTLICGGTIISENVVISAAHCFYDDANSSLFAASLYEMVVAKFYRKYTTKDNIFQRIYQVEEIRIPKSYTGLETDYGFDIALVRVKGEIQMSNVVLPACLDLSKTSFKIAERTVGKVSGWGYDSSGFESDILLSANLTYASYESCIRMFPREDRDTVSQDKICGGNKTGPGVRRGDSGSGYLFMHPYFNQYYLRGVVSTKLVSDNSISLFTDIEHYTDWIQENLIDIENRKHEKNWSCFLPKDDILNFTLLCNGNVYNANDYGKPTVNNSCEIIVNCENEYSLQSACEKGKWVPELKPCLIPDIPIFVFSKSLFSTYGSACTVPADTARERYWTTCGQLEGGNSSADNANENCQLHVSCKNDYYIRNSDNVTISCWRGTWRPKVPRCVETCPKPAFKNVNLACYKGNVRLKCDDIAAFVNGTKVRPSCKPYFHPDRLVTYKEFTCNGGKWSNELFKCVPDCGKVYKLLLNYSNKTVSEKLDKIPWHAAIYDTRGMGNGKLVCGGTIISERLIITAARCFHNEVRKTNSKSIGYEIVVGKFNKNFQTIFNTYYERSYKIKQVIISNKNVAKEKSYKLFDTSGIAIIVTKEKIRFNVATLPACVDLRKFEFGSLDTRVTGKVVALGEKTEETSFTVDLPYINHTLCQAIVGNHQSPVTTGAFCADTRIDSGIRRISTGSGYLVQDTKTSAYFIHGVLISKSIANNGSVIAIFTDLSQRVNWISKVTSELGM